jgi:hypothetical protein
VTAFAPGSSAPGTCNVYGWTYDITGKKLRAATITAKLNNPRVKMPDSSFVQTFEVSAKTDTSGYFHMGLIPNSDLSDTSSYYIMTVSTSAGPFAQFKASVPDSTSWQARGNR